MPSAASVPIQLGPPVLLPSARVGMKVAVNRSDKPVYLDLTGKPLCKHGEKACGRPCETERATFACSRIGSHSRDCFATHAHTGSPYRTIGHERLHTHAVLPSQTLPVCEMHEFMVNFADLRNSFFFRTLMKFTTNEIHHEFTSMYEFTL